MKLAYENQWFRFYLYEIEKNADNHLGIFTLRKRDNGRFWTKYYDIRLPSAGKTVSVATHYGTVVNGVAKAGYVRGGFLKDNQPTR